MRRSGDPRGGGTSAWLTAVRERTFGNVTEKFLMMTLCDYINGDDESWPGNTTLAPDIGVDPRTVRRTLARLEEAGVIRRYRRPPTTGKGRQSDAIVFVWEGFQRLPLVEHEPHQGDNLSGDQGDIHDGPRGHSATAPRGQIEPLSSFRTPQLEPPQKTPSADKRRRLPDPFIVTASMQEWSAQKFPAVDWREQTEQFRDHHRGNGTIKLDWEATWRTWIRNAGTRFAPRQTNGSARMSNVEKSWRNIQDALG